MFASFEDRGFRKLLNGIAILESIESVQVLLAIIFPYAPSAEIEQSTYCAPKVHIMCNSGLCAG